MKESVIGRIVLDPMGRRIVQPISNMEHARRVIDYQQTQREFMAAAAEFMNDRSVGKLEALHKAYTALKVFA